MPKSTRDWAKRKLDEARKHIDWTGFHLSAVADMYKDPHPEIAEPLGKTLELLKVVDDMVIRICHLF